MKKIILLNLLVILFLSGITQNNNTQALKGILLDIANETTNHLFELSCRSIISVIEAEESISPEELTFLDEIYNEFISDKEHSPARLESYLTRKQNFIIAWQSPTDNNISYSWLKLPKDWDKDKFYPMYVQLHGYWDVADNAIEHMTYPFRNAPSSTYAFEDGYQLSPWGRGNLWYDGISETDIWECIAALEEQVKIDPQRKYLCGHSMGGYGTYYIGSQTPNYWAALGAHAAALWWNGNAMLTPNVATQLQFTPVYFVCGDYDGLLNSNIQAYNLLRDAGNTNIEFVTFEGDHEYRSQDVEAMYDWMKAYTNDRLGINVKENSPTTFQLKIQQNAGTKSLSLNIFADQKNSVNIEVMDISGKCLFKSNSEPLMPGENKLEIYPDCKVGMYILKVSDKSISQCKSFIVY